MVINEQKLSKSKEAAAPKKTLRALLVEDSEFDATLLQRYLEQSYQVHLKRVQNAADLEAALKGEHWHVLLCDYWLPGFGFAEAIKILHATRLELPCIVVSGAIGEELAVGAMKAGAHDYIMKDNLMRLGPAIEREIRQAQSRRERAAAIAKMAWLAAIVDSMNEAVIGTDHNGKITSWNSGAERLYGFTEDEALGQAIELVVPGDLRTETRQRWEGVRQGGPIAEFETTLRLRRDGTTVDVSSAISPVKGENGEIVGTAILAVDITERKRAEEERKKIIRELNETLAQVRTLHGLLPICAACKKIRDDEGQWQSLEAYISGHTEAQFSHSICPTCAHALYPDFVKPRHA